MQCHHYPCPISSSVTFYLFIIKWQQMLSRLKNSREKFEFKLLMMNFVSRVIATHKLLVCFYSIYFEYNFFFAFMYAEQMVHLWLTMDFLWWRQMHRSCSLSTHICRDMFRVTKKRWVTMRIVLSFSLLLSLCLIWFEFERESCYLRDLSCDWIFRRTQKLWDFILSHHLNFGQYTWIYVVGCAIIFHNKHHQ